MNIPKNLQEREISEDVYVKVCRALQLACRSIKESQCDVDARVSQDLGFESIEVLNLVLWLNHSFKISSERRELYMDGLYELHDEDTPLYYTSPDGFTRLTEAGARWLQVNMPWRTIKTEWSRIIVEQLDRDLTVGDVCRFIQWKKS